MATFIVYYLVNPLLVIDFFLVIEDATRKPQRKGKSLWGSVKEGATSMLPGQRQQVQEVFSQLSTAGASSKFFPKLIRSVMSQSGPAHNEAVQVFLMHYLQKAASIREETAIAYDRPTSPLGQKELGYHRDYQKTNVLLEALTNTVVRESNGALNDQDIILVGDETSHIKTLKVYSDVSEPHDERDVQEYIQHAVQTLEAGETLSRSFICVDRLVDPNLPFEQRAARIQQITTDITASVPPKFRVEISEKIGIISTQKLGNQPVLIATAFGKGPMSYLDSRKRANLREHIITAGLSPTMLQATASLVQLNDFETLVGSRVSTKRLRLKEVDFSNLKKFYTHPNIVNYTALSSPDYPPAVRLLAEANSKMVSGLAGTRIQELLNNSELGPIVNGSLNRIAALMGESIKHADNHTTFSLCHELMAEEFILLLNLTQPYPPHAFQAIYNGNRQRALETQYQTEGKQRPQHREAPPMVIALRSGMSCVDTVLRGLHQVKPNLKVAGLSNGYFQTHLSLSELGQVGGDQASYQSINPQVEGGLAASIDQLAAQPDVVYLDLRPAADTNSEEYAPKDLSIVENLLAARIPSDGTLTLAFDVTLDKLHSKEIDDFVANHQDDISAGRLNIVLIRSAQKFDQLGVDKFNAGHMEIHTADDALRDTFQHIDGQLTGLDYQALCFYHQHADTQIHDYLKLHYKNTNQVYDRLRTSLGAPGGILQLTPKPDKKLFYLEFTYPSIRQGTAPFQSSFISYVTSQAEKEGVALFWRDSFGFNESSICTINEKKTRLSLGTHPPEGLDKICRIIEYCDRQLRAYAEFRDYDLANLTLEQETELRQHIEALSKKRVSSSSSSSSSSY